MEKSTIKYWLDKSVDYAIGAFAGGGTLKMGIEFLSINAFYIWLISLIVAMGVWYWSTIIRKTKSQKPVQLEEVVGNIFKNQTVKIDNKKFINCKFSTCTLEYEGSLFEFENNNTFEANCIIQCVNSNDRALSMLVVAFCEMMKHEGKKVGFIDKYGNITNKDLIIKNELKSQTSPQK